MIIDLAVRGYLKIEEVESKSWFSSGMTIASTGSSRADGLKPFEKKLYSKLFDGKNHVLMSELATKFFPVIAEVKNDLYQGLSQGGYFDGNPQDDAGRVSWPRFARTRRRAGPVVL